MTIKKTVASLKAKIEKGKKIQNEAEIALKKVQEGCPHINGRHECSDSMSGPGLSTFCSDCDKYIGFSNS